MRMVLIFISLLLLLTHPVYAMEYTAPSVPESGAAYMPKETISFAEDLLFVLKTALREIKPEIADAARFSLSILCVILLVSVVRNLSAGTTRITTLTGTVILGAIMLKSVNVMVDLGAATILELSEYGKLLLPVLTGALATQGGISTSTALYTGTAVFSSVLTSIISKILIPTLYLYLTCCVASSAIGEGILKRITGFFKWLITWGLKMILYIFSGYMTITGAISGSADAPAVKAAKLTISGAVPVVGNILADASETILVSANVMKNSVGSYGLIAFAAILIGPFLQIGIQYLFSKMTAAVSEVFDAKELSGLVGDFSSVMGFLLAMTGSVCLLLMISIVCFMKGVS